LAGVAGALAAGAGVAGVVTAGLASAFFSSFLEAGAWAKAETANAEAIKVATNFIISFLLVNVRIFIPTYI
jgi:hypothetical protein